MINQPDRNLALELVRVTEAGAMAAAQWMGRGDKEEADQAAVSAMRMMLNRIDMNGTVVIGEGEKDEAPMIYNGEQLGTGQPPEVDIAVDPIDGTTLTANGPAGRYCRIGSSRPAQHVLSRQPGLYGQNCRWPGGGRGYRSQCPG